MANRYLAVLAQFGVIDTATVQSMQQALALTGSADAARQYAEARLQEAYTQGLLAQSERLFKFLAQNDAPSAAQWDAFWAQENTALWASVKPAVTETAQQSAIMASIGLGDSWRAVNEKVIEWVDSYYNSPAEFGSIPNLNLTARQEVATAFNAWQRGELSSSLGLPSLALELQPTFGEKRAKTIAITETTRIYSESTRQTAIADPDVVYLRWMTGADELVCSICGPLHGRIVGKGEKGVSHPGGAFLGFPPAHPNCRCRLAEETALTAKIPLRDNFNPTLPKVAAPTPKTAPVAPPEWKPAMSRAQADAWAAESVYKSDTYHVTSGVANERSIKKAGFDLSKSKFGRMWGDGVYVGVDDDTAKMYKKWTGPSARKLTVKLNINNPFVYREEFSNFKQSHIVASAYKIDLGADNSKQYYDGIAKAVQILRDAGGLTQALRNAGYDALHIIPKAIESAPGGNQIVIFDPKNVVVIDD